MNTPVVSPDPPWYRGLTPRHGVVLGIAWLGWVFDVMDVFLLVLVKDAAMRELLGPGATTDDVRVYSGYALAITLVGWSVGGLVFGMVADRWGRSRTMALTILIYSLFTGLAGFSRTWQEFFALRFLAALGIGGEWGTGAAMIAEVFPRQSRAAAGGILQAAAGAGFFLATFLCGAVEQWVGGPSAWRYAFIAAACPAFMALLVRACLREPEAWVAARRRAPVGARERFGSVIALFQDPELRRRTLLGTGLAMVGIFAYWGTTFWAKESLVELLRQGGITDERVLAARVTKSVLVMNVGITLGFLLYIPITERIGRRRAFFWFYLGSLVFYPVAFLASRTHGAWLALFFVAGLFASGLFSGYTIYFPELFPTRLRATGAGFCYNVGRIVAAPGPVVMGVLQTYTHSVAVSGAVVGSIYALGLPFIPFLPETRGVRLDAEENGGLRKPEGAGAGPASSHPG